RAEMSMQPEHYWLHQQGEAFGSPGLEPRWTSSMKDAVCTAYSGASRIWFTCSHGILNEIYHPTIDHAQVRDMEFLIRTERRSCMRKSGISIRRSSTSIPRRWACGTSIATAAGAIC